MICLEKMLNFDDFTSLKFFYFLIVKKHQFYRFFLKKCLNLGFLYIRNGNSITTGPPLVFYFLFTFSRKPTKPDVPKGSPLWIFFGTVRLFFENFFYVPKGSLPPSRFLIFCNGMFVNKSRRVPPFTFFGIMRLFFERKKFSKISFFFQKIVLRFLSVRYSADFRRSRLVQIFMLDVVDNHDVVNQMYNGSRTRYIACLKCFL